MKQFSFWRLSPKLKINPRSCSQRLPRSCWALILPCFVTNLTNWFVSLLLDVIFTMLFPFLPTSSHYFWLLGKVFILWSIFIKFDCPHVLSLLLIHTFFLSIFLLFSLSSSSPFLSLLNFLNFILYFYIPLSYSLFILKWIKYAFYVLLVSFENFLSWGVGVVYDFSPAWKVLLLECSYGWNSF